MVDKLSVYPSEISGKKASQKTGSIKTVHRFDIVENGQANLSVEFRSVKFTPGFKSDSVVYLMIDGERIDLFRQSESRFEVPENLWVSIANCSRIGYRLKVGNEEFDARPDQAQKKNLKYFFERAIKIRDANLPPLPEGLKKW